MKTKICTLIIIFFTVCVFSQHIDPSHDVLKGTYEQETYTSKNNLTLISSGDFILSKQNGICWFALKPQQSILVMTENSVIQIIKNRKKIIGNNENPIFIQMATIIKAIFTQDSEVINTYLLKKEYNDGYMYTSKNEQLGLIVSDIIVKYNDIDGQIENAKISYTNGDYTVYRLKIVESALELQSHERSFFEN